MTGEAQDSATTKNDAQDLDSRIKVAMHSRVSHFKEQADSLTFEGVRRLLEKDLGLAPYALDVHKRFVKQCLLGCMDGADDDNASKNPGETAEQNDSSTKGSKNPTGHQPTKDVKELCSEDAEKTEDSPVLGLLTGHKMTKYENGESEGDLSKELPSESIIKKAIGKRAAYVKANSEKVSMAGLRRLLEEDLKLVKYALDPCKQFITEALDEVMKSGEDLESLPVDNKKNLKKTSSSKALKKVSTEGSSDSSDGETGVEEEKVKPKKKIVSKRQMHNSEGLKKRKRCEKETKVSGKQIQAAKMVSEDNSDAEDNGIVSEDGHSQSSADKPAKKREVATPAYGKRVEHLKTVIKSCGMSVPPSVYKKVKQAPENKRESQLIKELENILSREGLSSNPSEKEIKEVKRRKQRAKELEGIDMNNIVSSSRRRTTTSFVAPPKPKIPDESDSGDSEDNDNEDEDSDGNGDADNDDNEGNDDGDDENQTEELNGEDKGEDSD